MSTDSIEISFLSFFVFFNFFIFLAISKYSYKMTTIIKPGNTYERTSTQQLNKIRYFGKLTNYLNAYA